jgi:nitrate/nitrite transport system ATP-binding protein
VTAIMITNNVDEALLLSDRIIPMTRGPRATLGAPIDITLPRPRDAAHILHDDGAMHLRASVIACLTGGIVAAPKRSPARPEAPGWIHGVEVGSES